MPDSKFDVADVFHSSLIHFSDLIRFRANSIERLSWLFDGGHHSFVQDYFTVGRFGRTRSEKWLNQFLSGVSLSLWRHFVLRRVMQLALKKTNEKYLAPLFSRQVSENQMHYRYAFLAHLEALLWQHADKIQQSTFTELFSWIGNSIHHFAYLLTGSKDIFKQEKEFQNQLCLKIYRQIKSELMRREDPLPMLVYFCIRANWIDITEANVPEFLDGFMDEVNNGLDDGQDIHTQHQFNPYYQYDRLAFRLSQSNQTILYELDNCGEVVLDLLLIEYLLLKGHTIYLCAKDSPLLNDVTRADINDLLKLSDFQHLIPFIEQEKLCLITPGGSLVGKNLLDVSSDYQSAYQQSDFLILKGQGNFQSMPMGRGKMLRFTPFQYQKPIFYLMGVKADLTETCLKTIFPKNKVPEKQTAFLYYFDSKDKRTFPGNLNLSHVKV